MRLLKAADLAIESLASVLTLAGMYFGSTTVLGAALYLASMVFWFALTFRKAVWGIMPLNVASTALSTWNLMRALS